eukprot:828917-Rhodomonas_salina.1
MCCHHVRYRRYSLQSSPSRRCIWPLNPRTLIAGDARTATADAILAGEDAGVAMYLAVAAREASLIPEGCESDLTRLPSTLLALCRGHHGSSSSVA